MNIELKEKQRDAVINTVSIPIWRLVRLCLFALEGKKNGLYPEWPIR